VIPDALLAHWGEVVAGPALEHFATTRYRVRDWSFELELPVEFSWRDAGFSKAKLGYLRKKYPLDCLPVDGCIASTHENVVTYRRVDLTKGWMADILYLQSLGWTGPVRFECPGSTATIHAVRMSCLFPLVLARGFYQGVRPLLRRTLKRAIVHRLERRYEHYGQAKRANDWAHHLCTPVMMADAIATLSDG